MNSLKFLNFILAFIVFINLSELNAFAQDISESEQNELSEMIENPAKFHSEIEDITQGHPRGHGMTSEMMRFYTAVAIVESISCTVYNDPTGCEMFMESLKDPLGHIGFMAFMISAGKTTEFAIIKSQGKIPPFIAGNIGLMVGLIVQDLLVELVKDPLVSELIGLAKNEKYPTVLSKVERAVEIKKLLWNKTFGSSEWRGDKTAHGLSLLAAVTLSSGTQKIISSATSGTIKIGKQLIRGRKTLKIGFKLGRVVSIGGRLVRSVTPVGITISGIVIFLEWANVTEEYFGHPMRIRNAIYHRALVQDKIKENIKDKKEIGSNLEMLSLNYFKERVVEMEPAVKIYTGFNEKLKQMSKEFDSVNKYQNWLAKGLDEKVYKINQNNWRHENEIVDRAFNFPDYVNGFFCGNDPKNAIKVQKDLKGIPIPFKEYDVSEYLTTIFNEIKTADASEANIRGIVIYPYKAMKIEGLCLDDIKKLNVEKFESLLSVGEYQNVICPIASLGNNEYEFKKNEISFLHCQVYQLAMREKILKEGKLNGKDIRKDLISANSKAAIELMRVYETLRIAYIKRYEKRIYKTLLEHLAGQKITELNYTFLNNDGIETNIYYDSQINCSKKYFVKDSNKSVPSFAGMDIEPQFENEILTPMVCEGSIPGLLQELDYLNKLKVKVVRVKDKQLLEKSLENASMQLKYARSLKHFLETQISERKRVLDFELIFTDEDWVNMAKFYESFKLI